MSQAQTFRANVGIVALIDKWEVLALERIDKEELKRGGKAGTGQWQMPQGGLDEGEEPEDAWMRELREEIHVGVKDVEHLGCYPEWLAYELPKEVRERPEIKEKLGRGQVQLWSFVRLKRTAKIKLEPDSSTQDQEFFAYKWTTLGALAEETWDVRRSIYLKLALYLGGLKKNRGACDVSDALPGEL